MPRHARTISRALARTLGADSSFTSVANGADVRIRRASASCCFQHRYVLSPNVTPERFTVEGLRKAVAETIDLLASPAGLLVKSLVPRDPTGEFLAVVDQMRPVGGPRTADGVWVTTDGSRAVLIARTRASGSDTDGQSRAVAAVDRGVCGCLDARRHAGRQAAPHRSRRVLRALARDDHARRRTARGCQHAHRRDDSVSRAIVRRVALALGLLPVVCGALAGRRPRCRWDSARCTASRSDSARR